MQALVTAGSLPGQALPLPAQRHCKLFPHVQLRPV
jgi:hypothetical protein